MAPQNRNEIERDLNAELDVALARGKALPARTGKELQTAARRTAAKLGLRGGARPGAGRKALGKVRLQALVMPETLRALKVQGARGIGGIIDSLVSHAALQKASDRGSGRRVLPKKKPRSRAGQSVRR